MNVTVEQAGSYVQIAHKLRIQGRKDLNGTQHVGLRGATPETNIRPRDTRTGRYTDSDDELTLIELREGDPVDVMALLAAGAIRPHVRKGEHGQASL